MLQTPGHAENLAEFKDALRLHATLEVVVEHNISQLHVLGQPVATIKAVHSGPNASKNDVGGLEAALCLSKGARVMLTSNLWVDVGLVNGCNGNC